MPLLDSLISGEDDVPAPAALQLFSHPHSWAALLAGPGMLQGRAKGSASTAPHTLPGHSSTQLYGTWIKPQNPGGGLADTCVPSPSLKKGAAGEAV